MDIEIFYKIIGVMAAVLTSSGLIPQAIKGLKTKSLEDVSTGMLIILVCGTFLWFVYGLHKGDFIIIGANIVTCSFALIILLLKYVYNSKKNTI